jgi:hypothetical protein
MPATGDRVFTTAQAARQLGCAEWCVSRAYLRGLLPDAPRLGRTRLIREQDLPDLRRALEHAGYLQTQTATP